MDPRITDEIIKAAQAGQRRYYVPAGVTIAQWALESAWGSHMPAGSNNPFGIKWNGSGDYVSSMTWEVVSGHDIRVEQRFAKFATMADAFEAHARLLATVSLYKPALDAWYLKHDLSGGVTLMAQHYATDPQYAAKVMSIINGNGLIAYDTLPEDKPGAVKPAAPKPAAPAPATPVAPAPKADDPFGSILSTITDTIGSAIDPTSQPNSGSSSASASGLDTTTLEGSIMETILVDLIEGLVGKLGVAGTLAPLVPVVVEGTIKNISELPAAEADFARLASDIRSGKWSDVPNAIEAIVAEASVLASNYGLNLPKLNTMVKTMGQSTAVVAQTAQTAQTTAAKTA